MRPISKVEINLNKVDESVSKLLQLCSSNPPAAAESSNEKIKTFIDALNQSFKTLEDKEIQTSTKNDDPDLVLNRLFQMNDSDLLFIFTNIWNNLNERPLNLMKLYFAMNESEQNKFFKYLGASFNKEVYHQSEMNHEKVKDSTIEDLAKVSKIDFYSTCPSQLQYFFKAMTMKDRERKTNYSKSGHSNINELANVWDNILKSRNNNYVSMPGVSEGLVSYISSGKSHYNLQIMQKLGGHGSKPIFERIMKNTENKCKFTIPQNCTVAFTFDNIQQLYRSHRIAYQDQGKVLAIVVCSMLCHLVDGFEKSKIQYQPDLAPSNWCYNYKYNSKNGASVDKLDEKSLLDCASFNVQDEEMVQKYFEKDLEEQIDIVITDLDDQCKDSVDLELKQTFRKQVKLCEKNHIVENPRSNRKYCDREGCKTLLRVVESPIDPVEVQFPKADHTKTAKEQRSEFYYNMENIETGFKPEELSMGAMEVNPNTSDRIAGVLKTIVERDGLTEYSSKVILDDKSITKVQCTTNSTKRKFVIVEADGLPYKGSFQKKHMDSSICEPWSSQTNVTSVRSLIFIITCMENSISFF